MKKKALIIFAAMLTMSLTACGGAAKTETTTAESTTTAAQSSDASTAQPESTVNALAAEPANETAVPETDFGEPDIYFEGTENAVEKKPPNITVCMDNGETSSAGICRPLGYSWEYPDGEFMVSEEADSMGPNQMFDLGELAEFSYSDTSGTVEVQLPESAELTLVRRWTREQSYDAVYSGNVITLENDGNEYVYEMKVTYPESDIGGGTAYYHFIIK